MRSPFPFYIHNDVRFVKVLFLFLGRPGTLSTQISHFVLITVTIVVAVLRKMKTQSTSTTAFFRNYSKCIIPVFQRTHRPFAACNPFLCGTHLPRRDIACVGPLFYRYATPNGVRGGDKDQRPENEDQKTKNREQRTVNRESKKSLPLPPQ